MAQQQLDCVSSQCPQQKKACNFERQNVVALLYAVLSFLPSAVAVVLGNWSPTLTGTLCAPPRKAPQVVDRLASTPPALHIRNPLQGQDMEAK